jgi:hypothetical protein
MSLSDFDPTKGKVLVADRPEPSYEVDIERSDAAERIVSDIEMGDGTKTKSYVASEFIFLDSQESANRLSKVLTHAIKLCGGKAAPF